MDFYKTVDLPDDWIVDFYERGFNDKKKNAGKISSITVSVVKLVPGT